MDAAIGGRLIMHKIQSKPRARQLPSHLYELNITGGYNPNLALVEGRLLVIMRRHGKPHSLIGEIEGRQVVGARELRDRTGTFQRSGQIFEDIRLFPLHGKLMGIATAWRQGVPGSRSEVAVITIEGHDIVSARIQRSPVHEKNWMPCIENDELRFVYSTSPLVVLRYDAMKGTVHPGPKGVRSVIRGGSPLVPYKDGWLTVVHQVHQPAQYVHRFAVFDKGLKHASLSEPFFFQRLGGIEFCAGLLEHEGKFLISFGARDRHALVAIVEPETIEEMTSSGQIQPVAGAAPEPDPSPIPTQPLVPRAPISGPPPVARGEQNFVRVGPRGASKAKGSGKKAGPRAPYGIPTSWPGQGQGSR